MANPYYVYSGNFIPGFLARAETVAGEFQTVQVGFNDLAVQGTDTGAVNAYVVATQGAAQSNTDGAIVRFIPVHPNTGASTVAVDGASVVAICRPGGGAIQSGDMPASVYVTLTYVGALGKWQLTSPAVVTSSGTISVSAAAPTNKVGLVAAAGSSNQVIPIDITFALDQGIVPTWTGIHTFSAKPAFNAGLATTVGNVTIGAPTSGIALLVTASAGNGVSINTSTAAGNYGLQIAGTAGAAVAQDLLAVQQNGFSNGFRVQTDGTNMKYTFNSGNVTINAPVSGTALTINTVGGGLLINQTAANYGVRVQDPGAAGSIAELKTVNLKAVLNSNWTTTATALSLQINSTEYLGIGVGGNVTIAAPSSGAGPVINVLDGTGIKLNTAGTSNFLWFSNATDGNGFIVYSGSTMNFQTANTQRVAINGTGNVTISAPSSGTALTVNGASGALTSTFVNGSTISMYQGTGAGATGFGTQSAHDFSILSNNVNRMTFSTSGDVTIGAPTSGNTLSIAGLSGANVISTTSTGAAAALGIGWVSLFASSWSVYSSSTDQLAVGTAGAASLILTTNSNNRLNIDSSGNFSTSSLTSSTTVPWCQHIDATTAVSLTNLPVGGIARILKGTTTARTSNTTLTADPDLQFTNVPIGNYIVKAMTFIAAANATQGGIKVAIVYGGTVTAVQSAYSNISAVINNAVNTSSQGSQAFTSVGGSAFNPISVGTGALGDYLVAVGTLTTTSSNTLSVQWAQASSNANGSDVMAGSWIEIERIA